jgi:hypothetical protein
VRFLETERRVFLLGLKITPSALRNGFSRVRLINIPMFCGGYSHFAFRCVHLEQEGRERSHLEKCQQTPRWLVMKCRGMP